MARGRFVTIQSRGLLALPRDLRARHGLDAPGAQVEVVERGDGVIELHPHVAVRADQAWFWSTRWQEREREVDEHVERGEVERFDNSDEFLASLDRAAPKR
jgi:antitoxin MazE